MNPFFFAGAREKTGVRKKNRLSSYTYGFNGKENDPEANSTGSGTQDYGMRIYNPSLGRFLSVDPLTKKYPELTPYQFASDNPIEFIDRDGLEAADPYETIQNLNTVATSINVMSNFLYAHSFYNNNQSVREWSADIVTRDVPLKTSAGKAYTWTYIHFEYMRLGEPGSSPVNTLPEPTGDTQIGHFHTHPYSISEGSYTGTSFSSADISSMRGEAQGFFMIVESGTKRYAMVVEDKAKADAYFKDHDAAQIQLEYDDAFKAEY